MYIQFTLVCAAGERRRRRRQQPNGCRTREGKNNWGSIIMVDFLAYWNGNNEMIISLAREKSFSQPNFYSGCVVYT